ncbi:MAG: AEC family transporter, partial [Spirochaetales bacterium]|nr:AEC family transporter [Spirochaetales bacterium]
MVSALGSVASVILMIAIGYVLAKRGWFDDASSALIARLVVTVALPAYMLANLMGGYDRDRLLSMLPGLPIPFLAMGISYATSAIIARVFRVRAGRRGTFSSMFALSNTIFIGLPVNIILFGDASVPYVLLYYIGNTVLFWTIGVYGISRDGTILKGKTSAPLMSMESLRRILSPPFLGLLVAVALIMAGLHLPRSIMDLAKTLGSMTTPLSMIFIGIVIARVDWKKLRLERDLVLMLVGRYILSPIVLVLLVRGSDLPLLMKQVFLVQAMMPAMTQTPILAAAYDADAEYAGV